MQALQKESAPDHVGCYRCRAPRLYGKLNTTDPLLPYRHHYQENDPYCCRNDYLPFIAKAINILPYLPVEACKQIGVPDVNWDTFSQSDAQLLLFWLTRPALRHQGALRKDISNLHLLVLFRYFVYGHPRNTIHDADHLVANRGCRRRDYDGELAFEPADNAAASNLRIALESLYKEHGYTISFYRPSTPNAAPTQTPLRAPPRPFPPPPSPALVVDNEEQVGTSSQRPSTPVVPLPTVDDAVSPGTRATLHQFSQSMRAKNASQASRSGDRRSSSHPLQDKSTNIQETLEPSSPSHRDGPPLKRQKTTSTPRPASVSSSQMHTPAPTLPTPVIINYQIHLHGADADAFLQRSMGGQASPLDLMGLSSQIPVPLSRTMTPRTPRLFQNPETPSSPLPNSVPSHRSTLVRRGQSGENL
jgi:hypothetical protein